MQQYRKNLGKVSLTSEGAWSRENNYEILSIVYDEHTQRGFISRQNVPQGIDLYNKEYWMPFNVSGYADNNMIILADKVNEHSIKSYTLEEAILSIAQVGRRPGTILGFYNENVDRLDIGGRWELWQFNDTNIYNWENVTSWQSLYYNYNKFVGWFENEDFLIASVMYPEIGCYAFVGSELNEATIYRCDSKHVWHDTTQHAWDYVKINVGGNVTIGENGNWFNNGVDTKIPATIKGENGKTPLIRNNNNILEYSYDNKTWTPISDKIAAWFRLKDNKIQISQEQGVWSDVSDYIAAWFRWQATTADTQANNIGRLQISRDGKTWETLSPDISNNLHISRYIAADASLPTTGIAEGTIYAKGPTYAEDDANHDYPKYRLWVYAWKDDTLGWHDNGEFTSIAAGVTQTTGDSETEVMSQKAVTEKLSELGSEVGSVEISFNVVSNSIHGSTDNLLLINGKENEKIEVELVVSDSNATGSAELFGINEDGSSFRLGFIGFGSKFYTTLTKDVKYLGLYFIATSDLKITLKAVLSLTKRVNDMAIEVDEIKSEVDEIKSEVDEISEGLKSEAKESEVLSKELFYEFGIVNTATSIANSRINSDGTYKSGANGYLVSVHIVTEGRALRVEGDCAFQFQTNSSAPTEFPNSSIVGDAHVVCRNVMDVIVPQGALRLMVSRKEDVEVRIQYTKRIIEKVNNEKESIVDSCRATNSALTKMLVLDKEVMTASSVSNDFALNYDGNAITNSESQLEKYILGDAEKIIINGDCYFQFQNSSAVPTESNAFLVSEPCIKCLNNIIEVPSESTVLIVSKSKSEEVSVEKVKTTREQYVDNLLGIHRIVFTEGQYKTGYPSTGEKVDTTIYQFGGMICASVDCSYGDILYISGKGGNAGRLWAILDSSDCLIEKSGANLDVEEQKIVIPQDAAKVLINQYNTNKECYICKESKVNVKTDANLTLVKKMSYAISGELPNYFFDVKESTREAVDINGLYAIYDALVSEFPDYVSKELFLTDSVGNECYMYHFRNSKTAVPNNEILVIVGTHGMEYPQQFHAARVFEEICRGWKDNESLASLRWNVDFAVIPCLNVYGHINKQRKNSRGVDLNRNYGEGWTYIEDTSSDNYAGTEAFSEIESKAVRDYVLANYDKLIFAVDYHYSSTYAYVATEMDKRPLYLGWQRVSTMFLNKLEDYDQITEDRNVVNVIISRFNGDTSRWIDTVIPAVLLECPARLNLQENDKLTTDNFNMSNLVNLFLTAIRNARK